jgi:hypothetical protein
MGEWESLLTSYPSGVAEVFERDEAGEDSRLAWRESSLASEALHVGRALEVGL